MDPDWLRGNYLYLYQLNIARLFVFPGMERSLPMAAEGTLVGLPHVTKGMYALVPSSSNGDRKPYTMAVTGPESSLRNQPGTPGIGRCS
jgi:hypothetical protein